MPGIHETGRSVIGKNWYVNHGVADCGFIDSENPAFTGAPRCARRALTVIPQSATLSLLLVLLEFTVERFTSDVQQPRGFRLISVGVDECPGDHYPFDLF